MVMANETAVSMNLMSPQEASRVKLLLEKYNLPTGYNVKSSESFYQTFFLDKKSSDTTITFIIPVGIGDVSITDEIEAETIISVLNTFGDI